MQHFITTCIVVLLAIVMPGWAYGMADDSIKIGVLAPFQTQPGEGIRHGAQMAAEEINAAGGVLGKKLQLIEINSEYSSEKELRGYQRLVSKEQVAAVVGVAGDGIFPIMEQLAQYKTVMITTGAGSDKLTEMVAADPTKYKWFFRVMHKSSELGVVTADFAKNALAKKYGIRHFAIMVEDDIWTKYIRDIWMRELGNQPETQVVLNTTFSSDTRDFSLIFQQIQDSGAEYVLDACSRVDAASYLKRWAAMKSRPGMGAIPTGAGTERYFKLIGDSGLFVVSVATMPSEENPLTERSGQWFQQYYKRYGDPSYTSGYTYDAVYLLAEAITRAADTHGDKLIAALEQTDHRGVVARWRFGTDHHPLYGDEYRVIPIMQYQEPGYRGFKVIWPPARAKSEFKKPQSNAPGL
ncbi:MAG: ABC transporter substrate-binding protein [Magnetococcales bacterium]|nr:ABC transporter substrate-binding protein [Magnetococcales bacterium]